ncbi:hypothetical protein FNV43_RR06216 [Rhamnella rubrinervis]|uniref:Uncharacterized protein n=1 Tax=Rhamnella rubrinervis TaxID=2594499 RepID=A0A8K0HCM3_9ROSA|nr:hypothetical protein FNV43_RR06216 [Rhamnella rubrinervis]
MLSMTGCENQQQEEPEGREGDEQNGNVKVMTDEQLETLRKQIAVYAAICDQLVEMHNNLTAHQDIADVMVKAFVDSYY